MMGKNKHVFCPQGDCWGRQTLIKQSRITTSLLTLTGAGREGRAAIKTFNERPDQTGCGHFPESNFELRSKEEELEGYVG